MTKLKDTPIAGKLPKEQYVENNGYVFEGAEQICQLAFVINGGRNAVRNEVLNTNIDINEVAEVDVERVVVETLQAFFESSVRPLFVEGAVARGFAPKLIETYSLDLANDVCKAIAKSGVLKWKEA